MSDGQCPCRFEARTQHASAGDEHDGELDAAFQRGLLARGNLCGKVHVVPAFLLAVLSVVTLERRLGCGQLPQAQE